MFYQNIAILSNKLKNNRKGIDIYIEFSYDIKYKVRVILINCLVKRITKNIMLKLYLGVEYKNVKDSSTYDLSHSLG